MRTSCLRGSGTPAPRPHPTRLSPRYGSRYASPYRRTERGRRRQDARPRMPSCRSAFLRTGTPSRRTTSAGLRRTWCSISGRSGRPCAGPGPSRPPRTTRPASGAHGRCRPEPGTAPRREGRTPPTGSRLHRTEEKNIGQSQGLWTLSARTTPPPEGRERPSRVGSRQRTTSRPGTCLPGSRRRGLPHGRPKTPPHRPRGRPPRLSSGGS